MEVTIIGAGLAGCEAAWQLASAGIKVKLYEKKKLCKNEIQQLATFAELVCSNTFRSTSTQNAVGILKHELKLLNSFILECAWQTQVPADDALAVDRVKFSQLVDEKIRSHKNIEVIEAELTTIDENNYTIIACGPLISDEFKAEINRLLGNQKLFYLDASAPIIKKSSVDFTKAFYGARHKLDKSYICLPFTEHEFDLFVSELINAQRVKLKDFETEIYFQGCQPIEQLAKISKKVLLRGPMSPNGFEDISPKPYAVVQLRKDHAIDKLYNMVGFQTNLTWPEQKRVFKMIPGLTSAEFVRFGVMHKNFYINSPKLLNKKLQVMRNKKLFFAGQITGVEGYIESFASAIVCARAIIDQHQGRKFQPLPAQTVLGSLINYVTNEKIAKLKPMKANLGILNYPLPTFSSKEEKNQYLYENSLKHLKNYLNQNNEK